MYFGSLWGYPAYCYFLGELPGVLLLEKNVLSAAPMVKETSILVDVPDEMLLETAEVFESPAEGVGLTIPKM
ncbi:hypothetical protein PR002_g721 [Phytophthora rubi]|uniref:Uncharacterized protein n=1 Tax=Phytophthora rubi TaxID=129364 RepID=A0A6A3NYW4_9STRA|nr:hypothetical protein PR002_g721 [Phytophthora rubi]